MNHLNVKKKRGRGQILFKPVTEWDLLCAPVSVWGCWPFKKRERTGWAPTLHLPYPHPSLLCPNTLFSSWWRSLVSCCCSSHYRQRETGGQRQTEGDRRSERARERETGLWLTVTVRPVPGGTSDPGVIRDRQKERDWWIHQIVHERRQRHRRTEDRGGNGGRNRGGNGGSNGEWRSNERRYEQRNETRAQVRHKDTKWLWIRFHWFHLHWCCCCHGNHILVLGQEETRKGNEERRGDK